MATDLEKLITNALVEGVSKSSMLASSLAVKIAQDERFVKLLMQNIDTDALAKALARELIRKSDSNNNAVLVFKTIENKTAKLLFEQMQADAMGIK